MAPGSGCPHCPHRVRVGQDQVQGVDGAETPVFRGGEEGEYRSLLLRFLRLFGKGIHESLTRTCSEQLSHLRGKYSSAEAEPWMKELAADLLSENDLAESPFAKVPLVCDAALFPVEANTAPVLDQGVSAPLPEHEREPGGGHDLLEDEPLLRPPRHGQAGGGWPVAGQARAGRSSSTQRKRARSSGRCTPSSTRRSMDGQLSV